MTDDDAKKPKPDDEKPWNKPLTPEQLDKLRAGVKKKDSREKDQKNPPKK